MDGPVFLGPGASKRDHIIAARDRCDETVDRIRCVRTERFKYIRNFLPERAYTQKNAYKERAYPPLAVMKRLYAEGKLTPEQAHFMAPRRPAEELYDLAADPHEVRDLAGKSEHRATLEKLRGILGRWIRETGDQGAIPEKKIWLPKKRKEKRPAKKR
jgi:arylsulfatase A-like enzyme